MAESNKNNVANVSSAKGVKGGYIFTAPVGTALPTDYKTALPAAWKCLGYISEDGYVETLDSDSEDIKDMNGDLMASPQTSRVESAQLTLAEIKAATLKVMYGSDNVTDKGGMITVKHNGDSTETWPRRARARAQGRPPLAQGGAARPVLRAGRPHPRRGRARRACPSRSST